MTFISLQTITNTNLERVQQNRLKQIRQSQHSHPVAFSMHNAKSDYPHLVIRINTDTAKESRMIADDRADITFDPETREAIIYRCGKGGYKLQAAIYTKAAVPGKPVALILKTRWYEGMPWANEISHVETVRIDSDGIKFKLPQGILLNRRAPAP